MVYSPNSTHEGHYTFTFLCTDQFSYSLPKSSMLSVLPVAKLHAKLHWAMTPTVGMLSHASYPQNKLTIQQVLMKVSTHRDF